MHSRRTFLKTAGSLTIVFSLRQLAFAAQFAEPGINAWLEILADGRVRVFTGKLELGQGISIAIAQVAAEELNLDINKVTVSLAETEVTPNENYTAGSTSIESSAMSVRKAAAIARQQLLELAAAKTGQPVTALTLEDGRIFTKDNKQSLTLYEVLDGRQLRGGTETKAPLKPKAAYRYSGKPVHRPDVALMVKGQPIHVHDLRFPGMVHARIVRPPAYDARLLQLEDVTLPGVLKVVRNGSFLGVITSHEYAAIQAQKQLAKHCQWSAGPPLPGGQTLISYIEQQTAIPDVVKEQGTISNQTPTLQARYFKPYIMHGATGPSCAVAIYEQGKLSVWTHSQGVYPLRAALQQLVQLPAAQIHVKGVPGSGCYGHNGADDVAAEAALLAMAYPGKHVRLQWSREEEHSWEPYGSAMLMQLAATLHNGKITEWQYGLWSDTHGARPGGKAANLLPARFLAQPLQPGAQRSVGGGSRNSEPYYTIPGQKVTAHFFKGPLRTSSLRSLGAFANVFAIESFMDELAEKAGKDAYTFRLQHLDDARAVAVVQKLQSLVPLKKGIGIAFARYKNSGTYCAVAAQVQVNEQIRVQQLWAVIDTGEVINPDGVKNQIEGGLVQATSWTLQGQVQFDAQHITSMDWARYPLLRIHEAPAVEVVIIDRPEEEPMGAGEAAQGPAAAAIVNAVYSACGRRIRNLPLK